MPTCQQTLARGRRGVFSLFGTLAVLLAVTAFMSACTLNPAPDGVTVSDGPPSVRLASPLPNATYLEGVPVNIQAYISNAGPDIDRVEVAIDNAIVDTKPTPNTSGAVVFSITNSWPAAGVGAHTVSVTAFRADGSASEPATATFNILAGAGAVEVTEEPTDVEPTATPESDQGENTTDAGGEDGGDNGGDNGGEDANTAEGGEDGGDEGGEDEPEPTPSSPVATFNQGVNLRRGPGTNFNPPISSYATGQTADILAINPAGDWYKVRGSNGEGWVFASLVSVSGDVDDLPRDPGPPTPVPATPVPTPVPSTPVPQSQANLVAGEIRLDPDQPVCGETYNVEVDLANLGSTDTTTSGLFTVQDIHKASGAVTAQTQGPIPIIRAGETVESADIPITSDTFVGEEHTVVVILNPSGSIPETGSGDNRREVTYTLQPGC